MPQTETPSRYEINQKVRMIFTRHDADLSKIDYSFMGATVYLSGELAQPDRDYSHKEIENIVSEISAIPQVRDIQFDLSNWMVLSAEDSWQISQTRKSAVTSAAQQGALVDSTIVIDKSESLTDVLDDLELNLNKENKGETNQD